MKHVLIAIALFLWASNCGAQSVLSQLTNTNASHELPVPAWVVPNYAGLIQSTPWPGDLGYETDNGQFFKYNAAVSQWQQFNYIPAYTATFTPSPTNTYTATATYTATPVLTSTPTYTSTFTYTYTPTYTPTGSNTPTNTSTNTYTNTPTYTATNTSSPTPAAGTPTWTPTNTLSPTPTYTNTPTRTPTGSATPTYTSTSTYTNTPMYTSTPTYTNTPTFTFTNTATATWTVTPIFTQKPSQGNDVNAVGYYVGLNQSGAITWASGQAYFNLASHGFAVGDWVAIAGATPTAYNIVAQISSVPNANYFTYAVPGNPTTPSTGTAQVLFWWSGGRSSGLGKISSISRGGNGSYTANFYDPQANVYYPIDGTGYSGSTGLTLVPIYTNTSSVQFNFYTIGNVATDPSTYMYLHLGGIQ
jgi:hypothetical protein